MIGRWQEMRQQVTGGVPCTPNRNERLVRTEKSIRAGFIDIAYLR